VALAIAFIVVNGRVGVEDNDERVCAAQVSTNSAILGYVQAIKVIMVLNRASDTFKGYASNMAPWRDTMVML